MDVIFNNTVPLAVHSLESCPTAIEVGFEERTSITVPMGANAAAKRRILVNKTRSAFANILY